MCTHTGTHMQLTFAIIQSNASIEISWLFQMNHSHTHICNYFHYISLTADEIVKNKTFLVINQPNADIMLYVCLAHSRTKCLTFEDDN